MLSFHIRWSFAWWLLIAGTKVWAVPQTEPPAGLREHTPTTHALVGARIGVSPGKVIEKGNLVMRDGVITAVGADAAIPSSARIWPMTGKTLYAGFIDSCATLPADSPTPADGGPRYWNDQIRPETRAEQLYRPD